MQTDPKLGLGLSPKLSPLQNLLTNGLINPYSGFTFQVQLLRSLHVHAISEVNAYTPVLVIILNNTFSQDSGAYSMQFFLFGGDAISCFLGMEPQMFDFKMLVRILRTK